jgi:hypothetical protein
VVYDAQTYVRLLRGSSPMGGTRFFGTSGFSGTQGSDSGYPYGAHYATQSYANGNAGHSLAATASADRYSSQAGATQTQQHQRLSNSGNDASAGRSHDASGEGDSGGASDR